MNCLVSEAKRRWRGRDAPAICETKNRPFDIIAPMKNILRIALPIVAAVVIGGGGGYYAVDELVMRRPQGVVEAMARAARVAENGASGENAAKGEKVVKGAHSARRAGGARGIRWIAEPKHGPYKSRPYQVAEVRKDGAVVAKAITPSAARRGLRATFARSLRKWGKAPKEERDSWLRRFTGGGGSDEGWNVKYSSGTSDREDEGPLIYPGDVYLDGIPMINQGPHASHHRLQRRPRRGPLFGQLGRGARAQADGRTGCAFDYHGHVLPDG